MQEALLNHVGPKLVQTVLHDVVDYFFNYQGPFLVGAVLQDMSDNVVAILVHGQLCYQSHDLVHNPPDLLPWEPLHYSLHYAASVFIFAEVDDLAGNKLNYGLRHVEGSSGDQFLDNMVSLLVVHAFDQELRV